MGFLHALHCLLHDPCEMCWPCAACHDVILRELLPLVVLLVLDVVVRSIDV